MQGRPQAIDKMTMVDSRTLLRTGRVATDKFKTRIKYRIQMITTGALSHRLLELYVDTIRPSMLSLNNIALSPMTCILNYDGVTPVSISRRLIEFFDIQLGMHITTTTLRSLLETKFQDMFENGMFINDIIIYFLLVIYLCLR